MFDRLIEVLPHLIDGTAPRKCVVAFRIVVVLIIIYIILDWIEWRSVRRNDRNN